MSGAFLVSPCVPYSVLMCQICSTSSSPSSPSTSELVFDSSAFRCVSSKYTQFTVLIYFAFFPLDLSKPLVDDKALLPAIIVTPSSPIGDRDFRIAFLAKEPVPEEQHQQQQSLVNRVTSRVHSTAKSAVVSVSASTPTKSTPLKLKPRTYLLLFIPIVILICHLLAHRMLVSRPHMHFDTHVQEAGMGIDMGPPTGQHGGWFGLGSYRDVRHARDFVIEEEGTFSSRSDDSF
jgi:hypothetical protein